MAKFKAGDRVVATKSWIDVTVGSEYEVTTALEHGVWIIDDVGDPSFMGYDEVKLVPVAEATGTAATGTLRIEPGKFYKTRDGRKVGPMRVQGDDSYPWLADFANDTDDPYVLIFKRDGTNYELSHLDLIAEWVDEPSASNDNAPTASTAGFTVPLDDEALPPNVPPVAPATSGKPTSIADIMRRLERLESAMWLRAA